MTSIFLGLGQRNIKRRIPRIQEYIFGHTGSEVSPLHRQVARRLRDGGGTMRRSARKSQPAASSGRSAASSKPPQQVLTNLKVVKGFRGLGIQSDEQGIIVSIDPDSPAGQAGELNLGASHLLSLSTWASAHIPARRTHLEMLTPFGIMATR